MSKSILACRITLHACFVSFLVALVLTPAPADARTIRHTGALLHASVRPSVVRLHQETTIAVSGLHARSVQVRLEGGTYADGTSLPWRSLRLEGAVWHGRLPAPALRGVYRPLLRVDGKGPSITLNVLVRVFAPGTLARPSFPDAIDVVRWWVASYPRGTVAAIKRWPRPGFDRRDVRWHRLFVVAYSPPGRRAVSDRLGVFVTAVRDRDSGRWRFLEATVAP